MSAGEKVSVDRYIQKIRDFLPKDGSISLSELELRIARSIGEPIDREEFEDALKQVASAERYRDGRVRMTEPDLPEAGLMGRVGVFLTSDGALEAIMAKRDLTLLEDTSFAGARGTGTYSRPDFVMATIRRFKFDPASFLDVYSFELKNRQGANLQGVHETLAHARFAHYSFYVIPRSRIRPEQTDDLIRACSRYDLGVITFTIGQNQSVGHFRFEQFPKRRAPDPSEIEAFIENRFSREKQESLKSWARHPHG